MRIIHFTNNDFDGAGRSVIRLHQGLLDRGLISIIIVKHKSTKVENVYGPGDWNSLLDIQKVKDPGDALYGMWLDLTLHRLRTLLTRVARFLIFRLRLIKQNGGMFNVCFSLPSQGDFVKIVGKEDLVVLHSIQNMIEPETIVDFYQKSGRELIIQPLDMEQLTGGCHFNFGCEGFVRFCENCPQLRFASFFQYPKQFLKRKENVLSRVPHRLIVKNSFSAQLVRKSRLFRNSHVDVIPLGIDQERTLYTKKSIARDKLGLSQQEKIILFGCFSIDDPRKGGKLLRRALDFAFNLGEGQDLTHVGTHVRLITFGRIGSLVFRDLGVQWSHIGQIESSAHMNLLYRSADVLVSPSIDDLGPAILVEGFCNELPLVSFDLGVAQDLVLNGVNGYLVPCFDTSKFGTAIRDCLAGRLSATVAEHRHLDQMRQRCSVESEVDTFLDVLCAQSYALRSL